MTALSDCRRIRPKETQLCCIMYAQSGSTDDLASVDTPVHNEASPSYDGSLAVWSNEAIAAVSATAGRVDASLLYWLLPRSSFFRRLVSDMPFITWLWLWPSGWLLSKSEDRSFYMSCSFEWMRRYL